MRRTLIPAALVAFAVTPVLALDANAKVNPKCGSVRLNQNLKPDSYGLYGAFGIQRHGTSCGTARRVADRWVHDKKSPSRHPWRYNGWACNNSGGNYQQYGVTCTQPHGRITFKAVLPPS